MDFAPANEHPLDPFPHYARMREAAPVYHDEQSGSWHVFRYDDVQQGAVRTCQVFLKEGQKLSVAELLGFCSLLLVAGNETTTNLIGNAVLCFAEVPGTIERLLKKTSLLPQAIEEVLRFRSPVQSMYRVTVADTTLGGVQIPAGAPLVAWIGSANRDERQFQRPAQFDIDRGQIRHLAFGHGIHFCLGAPLARLGARIALEAILSGCPDWPSPRDRTLNGWTAQSSMG